MRRTTVLVSLLTATALVAAGPATGGTAGADPTGPPAPAAAPAERGGPGTWSKVSTGTVNLLLESSLHRTADGVLHVVYPRSEPDNERSLGHTSVRPDGTTALQGSILGPWSIMDATPAVVAGPGGGLRAIFGGQATTTPGPFSDGRMYTATAPASGATWTLSGEAVGQSHSAYASYGTAATTLADGTPVAAFPLNSSITWHVGTGGDPDQSFDVASCCAYDLAMVRSGNEVWLGWYGNGGTAATNGTFVRRIHPTLGPILKAPSSSAGADSLPTGRVALAARAGGGVYAAYCSGYPTCRAVRLWRVGSAGAAVVPGSAGAGTVALAAAPGGRLWLAWSAGSGDVRAVRTDPTATRFGAVRAVNGPAGHDRVYALTVDGGTGRGDVVVNPGDGFWHTQVLPGLALRAAPTRWRAGKRKTVRFTLTDAGARVAGVKVTVAGRRCTTGAQGTCKVVLPQRTRPGRKAVRATKAGYGAAGTVLRVTKKKKRR